MVKTFQRVLLIALLCLVSGAVQAQNQCSQSVQINVTAATTGELVAAEGNRTVYVCGFVVSGNTAATGAQFKSGTGTTCGTATVNLTGTILMPVTGSVSYGSGVGVIMTGLQGGAVCVQATTGAVTGVLSYQKQ